MQVFIKDVPVHLTEYHLLQDPASFDKIVDYRQQDLRYTQLQGHVLVTKASLPEIRKAFEWLITGYYEELASMTFGVTERGAVLEDLMGHFHLVEAGGGVVEKGDQVLLMYRRGAWDLPKGKLDKRESFKEAAVREVEEECAVKVSRKQKITSTWHTYTAKGKMILKRTKWYAMDLVDDSKMAPQAAEGIEKLEWVSHEEAARRLAGSYRSLSYLFDRFLESKKEQA